MLRNQNRRIPLLAISLLCCVSLVSCSKETYINGERVAPETVEHNQRKAAELNVELAVAYLQKGQTQRAKTKLLRAMELDPNLSMTYSMYGFYLERIGNNGEAADYYRKAVNLRPYGGSENNNYAAYLCREGHYGKAIKHFRIAIADVDYQDTADAYMNAGLCAAQEKIFDDAYDFFERAARQDPMRSEAYLEMAWIRFEESRYDESAAMFGKYDALPHDITPRSLYLKARLSYYFDDADGFASASLILRSQFPNSREASVISKMEMKP